ncbi:sel1 repeat family protein [Aquibacillus koreensis]|uniref:Sel1 repeat family protein n=1 Tax=Aquibacillus koreensis TaxID=279446 RepID=A0A9X3WJE8_9BACI|nr:sel1 repeat family protein [Aquibacillus koreensis]MCT2534687.1 sel1 repeat family protein [Aquibacillus koreensis]MDC3419703.1 sel1 repeat family protein [Aquibacillus koreensis]
MDLQQELSRNGHSVAAELLANLTASDHFLEELSLILRECVASTSNLPDDMHILYTQLVHVTTFQKKYKPILLRDLEIILSETINPTNDPPVIYIDEQEEAEVISLYQKAFKGNADAQFQLGHFYKSIERGGWAFDWFQAAAEAGSADALYWLGNEYFVGKVVEHDLEKTYFYYKEAAEKGHGDALNNYADMYLRGEYVEKDEKRALEIFMEAADKGVPEAMYTLGYMYENGVGTEIDMAESKRWFTESALAGDVFAANRLGHEAVEDGRGDEAIEWYQMAADRGDSYGEFNLGLCYESGIGTQVNMKKAKYWYQKAALKGDDQAKQRLGEL